MCGIAGILSLVHQPIPELTRKLGVMNDLQKHRGPDGEGVWQNGHVGFGHRRLSIIDLENGSQPMQDGDNWITFNGEIYNYLELRDGLGRSKFKTRSDTEVILKSCLEWGSDCVNQLRGMFAFAVWCEKGQTLFCARDRFGIKPFYYTIIGDDFYFASEPKALLPFLEHVEIDVEGLKDYLTFQFCLGGKTLFKNIRELPPGYWLSIKNGVLRTQKYWEVYYNPDFSHTETYFKDKLEELLIDSAKLHMRSDVPVGAYISGGLDSSAVASMAGGDLMGFTGRFSGPDYDESYYARCLAKSLDLTLRGVFITASDFIENIRKVIYQLDYPVAGPGAFSQYMVAKLAAQHRKVVLGGLGGDEIFGGYVRYLIAYFEQCLRGAISGTSHHGNFVVTYESIIPNLVALKNYKPLMQSFWAEGMFEPMPERYFRLVNRAEGLSEVRWELLGEYQPFDTFKSIFSSDNVRKDSYFDLMTHFDFKTLLPALLQVEDRTSMAHGLEARVPLLDHPIVELAATIPANIKFKNGNLKHIFREAVAKYLPREIIERKDKMGFPTPFAEWTKGKARDFIYDTFSSKKAQSRDFVDNRAVLDGLEKEPKFGRKIWSLLCLEIWQQEFHDQ